MKKIVTLFLLLFGTYSSEIFGWAREPMDANRCQQMGKTMDHCRKKNDEDNAYTFEALLTLQVYEVYENLTPEQKVQAMNYADNNRMDPNSAVMKVAGR